MNSRRSILKLIGAAPAVAGSAAVQLAPMLSSPAVMAAGALAAQAAAGQPMPSFGVLGPVLGKQLSGLLRATEDEIFARRGARLQGLDADLGTMRSTSRSWKEARQRERDVADGALLRHANSVMWGN